MSLAASAYPGGENAVALAVPDAMHAKRDQRLAPQL